MGKQILDLRRAEQASYFMKFIYNVN